MSLIRSAAKGAIAGVVGTLAMDAVWYVRYRRGAGTENPWDWETAAGLKGYDHASAPAQVGRKAYKAITGDDPPPDSARLMTNAMHWSTGVQWAALYGVVANGPGRRAPVLTAAGFAPVVWLSSYAILGTIGVYKPIWKYDAKTLWQDFSAHLAYGTTTATAFAALNR